MTSFLPSSYTRTQKQEDTTPAAQLPRVREEQSICGAQVQIASTQEGLYLPVDTIERHRQLVTVGVLGGDDSSRSSNHLGRIVEEVHALHDGGDGGAVTVDVLERC